MAALTQIEYIGKHINSKTGKSFIPTPHEKIWVPLKFWNAVKDCCGGVWKETDSAHVNFNEMTEVKNHE